MGKPSKRNTLLTQILREHRFQVSWYGLAHGNFRSHGKTPRRPNDFFESAHVDPLLKQLRPKYRHIIIDTPPGLNMADAFLIAQHVDGVIFAAEYGKSR